MKNKEIEELLNKIRNSIKTHKKLNLDDDMLVVLEFDVIQWNLLLSYIEQLEKEKEKITKSRDFHLRFNKSLMNRVDEYKKEKEQLENNKEKEYVLVGRMQLKTRDYIHQLEKENKQLKHSRDKAIEVINTQLKNAEGGTKDNLRIIKFNLIKGSCTFEDLKTEEDYKYILKGDSDV